MWKGDVGGSVYECVLRGGRARTSGAGEHVLVVRRLRGCRHSRVGIGLSTVHRAPPAAGAPVAPSWPRWCVWDGSPPGSGSWPLGVGQRGSPGVVPMFLLSSSRWQSWLAACRCRRGRLSVVHSVPIGHWREAVPPPPPPPRHACPFCGCASCGCYDRGASWHSLPSGSTRTFTSARSGCDATGAAAVLLPVQGPGHCRAAGGRGAL